MKKRKLKKTKLKKKRQYKYEPDYAVSPGEIFYETLQAGFLKQYICAYLGVTEKWLNDFFNGKVELTEEIATNICSLTNVPAHFWMNLEKNYWERKENIRKNR